MLCRRQSTTTAITVHNKQQSIVLKQNILCVCVFVFADCRTFLATKNRSCWTAAAALKGKSTALYQTVKILKAIFGAALRKGKHDNTCGKYTHTHADPIKIEHGKMDGKSDSRHTHKMLKNWPQNDFQPKQ